MTYLVKNDNDEAMIVTSGIHESSKGGHRRGINL